SYAQAPAMGDELGAVLAATRERLRGEARSLYQDGYRHGVKLAGQLTWSQLSWIVGIRGVVAAAKAAKQCQFDVMAGRLPDGARPVIEPDILADYVGRHADEGLDWAPSSVTLEGMDRALQDVWDHVHSPDGAVAPQPKQ
ncbi:MAG TPA: hypothetical protein VJ757_15375, partial [Pseudonocardiaceae bacterium]|nr:hypothetical protein [Pseudonocardiaceae bacterium]